MCDRRHPINPDNREAMPRVMVCQVSQYLHGFWRALAWGSVVHLPLKPTPPKPQVHPTITARRAVARLCHSPWSQAPLHAFTRKRYFARTDLALIFPIMSRSTDPGHFFQTDTSLSEAARKKTKSTNNAGNPIHLNSKLLAAIANDEDGGRSIFLAEAAGTVRRVELEVCTNILS